jgi:hypothetical protein
MFRDGFAAAQSFHPELGYLCPSPGLRRRVRHFAKLLLVAAALVGGAALALSSALFAPPAGEATRVEPAVVAQVPLSQAAIADAEAVPATTPPRQVAPATVAPPTATAGGEAGLAHAQAACDDLSASFLSSQCRSGRKSRAARSAPAPSRRLATVPLGRTDAPQPAEPNKSASKPAPIAAVAPAELAPADKPAKKTVKTAHKNVPVRDNAGVDTAVAAPAPSPTLGLFGFFRNLPGLPNGPFATFLQ